MTRQYISPTGFRNESRTKRQFIARGVFVNDATAPTVAEIMAVAKQTGTLGPHYPKTEVVAY